MGVVGRPHGVRGLLHVHSFTADPADLARYNPLLDERGRAWTLEWKGNDVAALRDAEGRAVPDRNAAEKLVNVRLYAPRERLPDTGPDDYYIADLVGLLANDAQGGEIGRITTVHDYGAGASLEITKAGTQTQTLIVPFTRAAVPVVDIAGGQVTVIPPEEIDVREQAA